MTKPTEGPYRGELCPAAMTAGASGINEAEKLLIDLIQALPAPRSRKATEPWQRALEYVSRLHAKAKG